MEYGAREDFFTSYLRYTGGGETPTFYNRWAAITAIGALIGKRCYFKFGHKSIYPNVYCMLIGSAGARKGTAIKTMKKLILQAGYSTVSASKVTKEKFLMDLGGIDSEPSGGLDLGSDDALTKNLFGSGSDSPAETFIISDEFNDFFGNNLLEFISLLGALWDWEGPYENRVKNSKSFTINDPCISIIGGNTPTGFSLAFPPEIIGQGFFSRLIMVFSEPTGRRIAFPTSADERDTLQLVSSLQKIHLLTGEFSISPIAKKLLEKIYANMDTISLDIRFESYMNRRFDHLIKLCMIHAAARLSLEIHEEDVRYANTVLSYTEHLMPRALGEFGKAKNADVSNKVIQILEANAGRIMTLKEIWKQVNQDLEKMSDLVNIMQNLTQGEKIQMAKGDMGGFLPVKKAIRIPSKDVVDYDLLSNDEKEIV